MSGTIETARAAFAAASAGRFDELASLLAPDLDWWGLDEETGSVQHCHGRETALGVDATGRLRIGPRRRRRVRPGRELVMVRARRRGDGEAGDSSAGRERWVIAEVRAGLIVRLRAFATENAALAARTLAD